MEKSSQIRWKNIPHKHFFPLKVVPLIEVLLYRHTHQLSPRKELYLLDAFAVRPVLQSLGVDPCDSSYPSLFVVYSSKNRPLKKGAACTETPRKRKNDAEPSCFRQEPLCFIFELVEGRD
jgi:hypothetical protein